VVAALPRGISRHVVRFVKLSGRVIAVKEIAERPARHEYQMLRDLGRLAVPCVAPVGIVTERQTVDGQALDGALVTQHLQFSMPYRALFAHRLVPDTASRLLDALTVLLVRLHLAGFYWGDVSLSNTLFRRDAAAYSAYLVDAETGEFHKRLTTGQRSYDLDLARTNIIGELFDLEAGDRLSDDTDPIWIGDELVNRYHGLWSALTDEQIVHDGAKWQVANRIAHLNDLGFDVGELTMASDSASPALRIQPKVVESGHHRRRLARLTGLEVQENQARRLLNDMDAYRIKKGWTDLEEEFVAHEWVTDVFEPAIRAIPPLLRGKLEPAQTFHEVQEHRWFMAQTEQRYVPLEEAVKHYVDTILTHRRDESALIGVETDQLPPVPNLPIG
jgi:tRNA A-37 threonylcarbamoyl transferase component Bud32